MLSCVARRWVVLSCVAMRCVALCCVVLCYVVLCCVVLRCFVSFEVSSANRNNANWCRAGLIMVELVGMV